MKLDSVPLHRRQEITVINRYVASKIMWPLTIYSFQRNGLNKLPTASFCDTSRNGFTSILEQILASHLRLPLKKISLASTLPSDLCNKCKLVLDRILKCSHNSDIKIVYSVTLCKYVKHDEIGNTCTGKENVRSLCSSEYERRKNDEIWKTF